MVDRISEKLNSNSLLAFAGFIIIVAGMRASATLLVPFLLAIFIAVICLPVLELLKRYGIHQTVSVLLVIAGFLCIGFLLVLLFQTSLEDFSASLPAYQENLNQLSQDIINKLQPQMLDSVEDLLNETLNPSTIMQVIANSMSSVGLVLTNGLLILLTVIFILFEASSFPQKIKAVFKKTKEPIERYENFIKIVNNYLGIKTVISFLTGITVFFFLLFAGIDFPILWALLAGILNFIPNIGSIIAAIPPVLLATIQYGPGRAVIIIIGFVVINLIYGNFLEPRLMGKKLGLSTLVVFVSLVFWGWVLGPVGMLLSVPLTMIVKIALEGNERTHHWAILLGPASDH
ncbi:AI-2E family transporter [Candidatus Neomarinimicrobiota bacterium]